VKTFATTSHPFDQGDVLGLKVAVKDFYKNLCIYSSFENIHFFLQSQYTEDVYLKQLAEQLNLDKATLSKVRFFPIEILPLKLANGEIDVLHKEDPKIDGLMQICRSVNLPKTVVVTGVTHSLNYADDYLHYLNMLMLKPDNADAIICTSNSAKIVLQELFEGLVKTYPQVKEEPSPKLPIIPLGMNKDLIESLKNSDEEKIKDHFLRICYVGRINTLVKADLRPFFAVIKKLSNKYSNLKFCIAGGVAQQQQQELQLLAHEIKQLKLEGIVELMPNCSNDEKINLLKKSDIFFSPVDNFQETFGLSIIEAMAANLPVICSDWGGYKDLVEHDKNGFLIKTYSFPLPNDDAKFSPSMSYLPLDLSQRTIVDPDDVYERLDCLISDPKLRQEMGDCSREKSLQYDWENIIKQYEVMWTELSSEQVSRELPLFKGISQAEIFKKYITVELNYEDSFKLTFSNMREIRLPVIHPFFKKEVQQNVLEKIIKMLLELSEMTGNAIYEKLNISDKEFTFQMSYLLKYGLIRPTQTECSE
jgi:glycosyltransferase involved in cell wall biosynthesis